MDGNLNTQDIRSPRYSSEEIVHLLRVQVGEVLAFAAAMARRTGLGLSEMAALEHLRHSHGGLTPTELGRRLSLSSGAVTALVDRLERPCTAPTQPRRPPQLGGASGPRGPREGRTPPRSGGGRAVGEDHRAHGRGARRGWQVPRGCNRDLQAPRAGVVSRPSRGRGVVY